LEIKHFLFESSNGKPHICSKFNQNAFKLPKLNLPGHLFTVSTEMSSFCHSKCLCNGIIPNNVQVIVHLEIFLWI
jgi:hypothetical protein